MSLSSVISPLRSRTILGPPCFQEKGRLAPVLLGLTLLFGAGAVQADNISSSYFAPIDISNVGPSSPYPSSIPISGAPGLVTKATVTLNGFAHEFPADVDVLLVAPSGQSVVLMSDAGDSNPVVFANLTFDDAAGSVPTPITSGTYRPTNLGASEEFSAPAPAGPFGSNMAALVGATANGTWNLYVYDDVNGNNGQIGGGWTLNLTTDTPGVTIKQAAGQADPTSNSTVTFDVLFSEAVTGFTASDVQLSGTADVGNATVQVTGAGPGYTVTVSGLTQAGTVIAAIPAGAATDADSNLSSASTSTDNSVTFGHAPTALAMNQTSVLEKQAAGAYVGSFITTDPDAGESFTYSLVGGDTAAFTIAGPSLRTTAPLDAAVQNNYKIIVRTTDSNGFSFDQQFTITVRESTKPTVTLASPTANQKLPISEFTGNIVRGTASDNVDVSSVKVRLIRKRGGVNSFWNGAAFVTTSSTVDADFAAGNWTLTNLPAQNQLDPGVYQVEVFALDAALNKSASVTRSFTLGADLVAPSVSISVPIQNERLDINLFEANTLNGSASDNVGVTSVKLKLQRKRGNVTTYWNGTEFTTVPALFDATVSPQDGTNVTWGVDVNVPTQEAGLDAGSYIVYATAYDAAGNLKTSARRDFILTGNSGAPDAPSAPSKSAGNS